MFVLLSLLVTPPALIVLLIAFVYGGTKSQIITSVLAAPFILTALGCVLWLIYSRIAEFIRDRRQARREARIEADNKPV